MPWLLVSLFKKKERKIAWNEGTYVNFNEVHVFSVKGVVSNEMHILVSLKILYVHVYMKGLCDVGIMPVDGLVFQFSLSTQIAKFMGPTWGPPGSCRPQMSPMLAPWTLLGKPSAGVKLLDVEPHHCCNIFIHKVQHKHWYHRKVRLHKHFWGHIIIKILTCQYRNSNYKDKMSSQLSYFYNGSLPSLERWLTDKP